MNQMIHTENISASYDDLTPIIRDISISVEKGKFIGILGPNGCGKTTLMRVLSRVIKPLGGVVVINDQNISQYGSRSLAKILGCVGQEGCKSFSFTVKDVVLMGRYPHCGQFKQYSDEDIKIANEAMSNTNILHLADRLITEISGGERQRVWIAQTLTQQPKIILLDEPTAHLDINHQLEILRLISNLTPSITVLCVFHDLNLASNFCDRLILMKDGKIMCNGSPSEVLTQQRIQECFDVNIIVNTHPQTGQPYIVPVYK